MTLQAAATCRYRRSWWGLLRSPSAVLALAFLIAACKDLPQPAAGFSVPASYAAESTLLQNVAADPSTEGDSLAIALDDGDFRTAAENFARALERDPDNFELRRQVFTLQLGIGDYPAALALADTLIEVDPAFGEARLLLASRHVLASDYAAAAAQIERIGERELVALATPVFDAWIAFGAGDADRAIAILGEADDTSGLERIQQYHAALLMLLADRPSEAVSQMRPLVDAEGRNPIRLVVALAAMETRAGNREAALTLLEDQLAFSPNDIVLETALADLAAGEVPSLSVTDPATGMADALLSLATALDDQNASAQALVLARLAGYLAPGQGDVALLIAEINLGQGNAEEAVRVLADVSSETPHAWEARLLRAQALASLEREAEAVQDLEAMADERPERFDALVAQGDILRRMERYADAERAYDHALQRVPEIAAGHWPLLYSRGITRERTDRWPEAEADFLQALELEPEQPLVLNYLGYSWVDQGMNLEQAETMLRRAVELRPDDGYIVDSLGWAYYRLGRFDEAVTYLERAIELRPEDPVINDHLGDAYWQVGRHREARFQWQRALTFEPEDDEVAVIEEKLQRGLQPSEIEPDRG